MVKSYVSKIQELEGEVLRLQSFKSSKHSRYVDLVESDDDRPQSSNILFPCSNEHSLEYDPKAVDISGEYDMDYVTAILLWFDGLYSQSKLLANKCKLPLLVFFLYFCRSLYYVYESDMLMHKGWLVFADGMEDHEKELEHSTMQERLDRELKELDKKLEQKEVPHLEFRLFMYDVFLNSLIVYNHSN